MKRRTCASLVVLMLLSSLLVGEAQSKPPANWRMSFKNDFGLPVSLTIRGGAGKVRRVRLAKGRRVTFSMRTNRVVVTSRSGPFRDKKTFRRGSRGRALKVVHRLPKFGLLIPQLIRVKRFK